MLEVSPHINHSIHTRSNGTLNNSSQTKVAEGIGILAVKGISETLSRKRAFMDDEIKRDFNKEASTWDDNPARVQLAHSIADAIVGQGLVSKDMNVLDYGAGTGLVTLALSPHVARITAADSSPGMLARLEEKSAESGLTNVKTTLLDLECDQTPEQKYDLIVSSMTMHHIEGVPALIGKFHDMLCTGGYLAIADLDLDGGEFHPDPTGVKHNGFDRKEIEQLYARAGFTKVITIDAHTVSRPVNDVMRDFTVFLAVGKREP